MPKEGGGVQTLTEVGGGWTDDVDLRLVVRQGTRGERTLLRYELQLAEEPPEEFSPLETKLDLNTFFTEFWARFNRLAVGHGSEAQKSLGWLTDISASLTQQVFPEDLQERLWELKDDVETVQIQSEEGWIPWELLQLRHRTASGATKHGQFLSEAFSLTRWHGPFESARRKFSLKTIGCLVAAADKLPYMAEEANDLKRLWAGTECEVEDLPSDLDAVRHRLSTAKLEGLHVIGHGYFKGKVTGSVSIDLGQAIQGLNPEILDGPAGNFGRNHPLVFFNTCHSARSGQALIDINSWATRFIKAGAGAFIGASWPIDDRAACLFATTFYEAFFRGLPIAKAASDARAKVRVLFPGDPTWLAYVVYAHPLAAYQRGRDEMDFEQIVGRKQRKARLAIATRPLDLADQELESVLESACAHAKTSLGIDFSRYRSKGAELTSLGFNTLDEAHDFGVELLEVLQSRRIDFGEQVPYVSIGLGRSVPSAPDPATESNLAHISSLGPTGQMVIDIDSWPRLSRDRQEIYGAEEFVRQPDPPRAIHFRRARVTSPAPEEADLVKLQVGKGLDPADPPYIGPDFFSNASRGFFGRNREINDLCEEIERNEYTLVFAPSGAGKSSLVHTGVPLHLKSGNVECILVRYYLPSEKIAEQDPDVFLVCIREKLKELWGDEKATDEGRLASSKADFADLFARRDGKKRVLILDQFENSLLKDDAISYMNVAEAREKLFHQLRLALRESDLRLVLVFREEYLAKVKDHCVSLRDAGFNSAEFYLKFLGERAALEVIRNHARMAGVDYEEGLAEKIVQQLSKNNEIAPVQLQVVCRMIWENLTAKEGTNLITSTDVARAAGDSSPGGSKKKLDHNLQKFIKSSVQQFYYRRLEKIASDERGEAKVDIELLHIGCMEFVNSSSHHDALQREGNKVGRLPEAIVKRLEDEYLIRRVEMDGKSYYELIHDTVADAISAGGPQFQIADWQAKRFTKDPNKLLYALKSLEFLVKRYKSESSQVEEDNDSSSQGSFRTGLFFEHDEMLKSIEGFQKHQGLFEDESEFVLRCVLASGKDINYLKDWAQNIASDYPGVFNRVLLEAIRVSGEDLAGASERRDDGNRHESLREDAERIRRNAVLLAGSILEGHQSESDLFAEEGIKEINGSIVARALKDDAASVWQAATKSLAKLVPGSFATTLTEKMASSSGQQLDRIYDILVVLGEISYAERGVLTPPRPWPRLDLRSRLSVFSRMWMDRLRENSQLLLIALVLGIFFTWPFTAALRAPFAKYGLTHTQEEDGALQGVFHSVAAGTGWVFSVTIPLLCYWILFELKGKPDPRLRRKWIPAAVGGFGGFVGGLLASSMVLFVFNSRSMVGAGWLDPTGLPDIMNSNNRPELLEVIANAFLDTRFGWIYPITGTFMGAGIALLIAAVACDQDWLEYFKKETDKGPFKGELSRVKHISLAIGKILGTKLHSLPLLTLPLVGALISYSLLVPGSEMIREYVESLLLRSLCDAMSLISGALGLSIGILYSFIVHAAGIEWVTRGGRKDDSGS